MNVFILFFNPLQVWWAASDLGWVVGHSYICYAPLLHGNSTILYEVCPWKGFISKTHYNITEGNKTRGAQLSSISKSFVLLLLALHVFPLLYGFGDA